MAGAQNEGGAVPKLASSALDIIIAAADLSIPGAGPAIEILKSLGSGGLGLRFHKHQQRLDRQFHQVMFNAFSAIAAGAPEVARAEVDAHLDDPDFAAGVRTVAAKMAESNPCDQALPPLGLLIAAYSGQRADPLFRGTAGFLSDCSAEDLGKAAALVHTFRKYGSRQAEIRISQDRTAPRAYFPARRAPGESALLRPRTIVLCPSRMGGLLLAHGLASRSPASGAPDDTHDPSSITIDPRTLDLLCELLPQPAAVPAASAAT